MLSELKCVLVAALLASALAAARLGAADRSRPPDADEPTLPVAELADGRFVRLTGSGPGGSAFDVGPQGTWYSGFLGMPTVHYDGKTFRMWFVGGELTSDPSIPYGMIERIGLATSNDGRTWEVANDGLPVLDLGPPKSADAKGCTHPFVLRVDEKWLMWYGAIDGRTAQDLGLDPAHVRVEQICLASSDDGIHWTRMNDGRPVVEIGAAGEVDSIQATGPHILRIGERYVMWYSAYNGDHLLAAATSSDGIHWERANGGRPLTGLEPGRQGQTGPSVVYDGRAYWMLYCADTGNEWKIYSAVSENGWDWRAAAGGRPVLEPAPTGNFGTAGYGRNHSAHPSQLVVAGNRRLVWYMAEDGLPPHLQRIGAMQFAAD